MILLIKNTTNKLMNLNTSTQRTFWVAGGGSATQPDYVAEGIEHELLLPVFVVGEG